MTGLIIFDREPVTAIFQGDITFTLFAVVRGDESSFHAGLKHDAAWREAEIALDVVLYQSLLLFRKGLYRTHSRF
ncbi:hypothetical protein DPMN_177575 [Dreissena polymorpha]|uniref:Uncharacterized protein n=1 Tax=Dreissena polymorpha TaxID=45954 RepID=A0A9D4EBX1_DREPO|nr:hypothetical protein DPMN_177575 [Dreissena polymorpha]